ncbi:MAG TPA: tetratricopeptide repeat protein [Elusimicrobiota bacterium]|nr:tetratricopeptide repeat protein [Elusimicrobiota bacterium]
MPDLSGRPRTDQRPSRWSKSILALSGGLAAVVLVEMGLRLGGFVYQMKPERFNADALSRGGDVRVLCLGESTTQGAYPEHLQALLDNSGTPLKFVVIDKGISGTNSGIILMFLENLLDTYRPDLVLTMIGINDVGWSVPLKDGAGRIDRWFHRFRNLRISKLYRIATGERAGGASRRNVVVPKRTHDEFVPMSPITEKAPRTTQTSMTDYLNSGELFQQEGAWAEAEACFRNALKIDPKNELPHRFLGHLYERQRKYRKAIACFKNILELKTQGDPAYIHRCLGSLYDKEKDYGNALVHYKKAVEINPTDEFSQVALVRFLYNRNARKEAYAGLRKARDLNPTSLLLNSEFLKMKQYARPEKPKRETALSPYRAVTIRNYTKIRDIVLSRGARLVCVQYPMRPLRPLEEIIGKKQNVFYVDNELSFREAVRRDGYDIYFTDKFGGDFGHCTVRGNRLLAENIVRVILHEVYPGRPSGTKP